MNTCLMEVILPFQVEVDSFKTWDQDSVRSSQIFCFDTRVMLDPEKFSQFSMSKNNCSTTHAITFIDLAFICSFRWKSILHKYTCKLSCFILGEEQLEDCSWYDLDVFISFNQLKLCCHILYNLPVSVVPRNFIYNVCLCVHNF